MPRATTLPQTSSAAAARAAMARLSVIVVLAVFQHRAALGIDGHIPLDVVGVAQLQLVDVFAVFIFEFGIDDGGAGVQIESDLVEIAEMLDGALLDQFDGLVKTEVTGADRNGGEGGERGGEQNGWN